MEILTDEEWHASLPDVQHGVYTTYNKWKCRCTCCRIAKRLNAEVYRKGTREDDVFYIDDSFNWKLLAACIGLDPAMFYEDDEDAIHSAKEICEECPVQNLCREYAMMKRERGIWGGMTERERVNFLRARRRKARQVA